MTRSYTPGFLIDDKPVATPTRAVKPKPDDTVILRGIPISLKSDIGAAFILDCCRNREKVLEDSRLREKYGIDSDAYWDDIVKNKALRLMVSAECERRMLSTEAARDAAAKIFTEAPEAMGSILRDNRASPRARVAASQELRATARVGDEKSGPDPDRVRIVINLGGDTKPFVYEGAVKPQAPEQPKEISDAE